MPFFVHFLPCDICLTIPTVHHPCQKQNNHM
jgi:hypothetical protein